MGRVFHLATLLRKSKYPKMEYLDRPLKGLILLVGLAILALIFGNCASTEELRMKYPDRYQGFVGRYEIAASNGQSTTPSRLDLLEDGRIKVSGPLFTELSANCVAGAFWGMQENPNVVSLGCSNMNVDLTLVDGRSLMYGSGSLILPYSKQKIENIANFPTSKGGDTPKKIDEAQEKIRIREKDSKLMAPLAGLPPKEAKRYIEKNKLLDKLQTDSYRQDALALIAAANAAADEAERRKRIGGIPTTGRLGGGFHGYLWGTSKADIRRVQKDIITYDEGNTIKWRANDSEYRFYFYDDYLASVEIVPSDMSSHSAYYDELVAKYGKPRLLKKYNDVSSNRRGDSFAWKREELVWDDGITEIHVEQCKVLIDPLNGGCMINPEFNPRISYDSKKLLKLLRKQLAEAKKNQ